MRNRTKKDRGIRRRASGAAVWMYVGAVALLPAAVAAEPLNTCTSGKIKCTNAFAAAVFKCVAAAYKKPPTLESQDKAQACVRKARQKFGTAVSLKPGCIDKIEAKENPSKPETICPLGADEFGLDDVVKDFTESMQDEIAPVGPSPFGSSKGCFAKLEDKQKLAKPKTLCGSDGNLAIVGGEVDAFVEDVVGGITH